jgi:hypothetical protein
MVAVRDTSLFNGWETVRCELLNTRICDMGLRIQDSLLEVYVNRLVKEFESKGLRFRPKFYLSDSWGCPDRVPVIGIPFYLANKRLARIEEEQTGAVEDEHMIMMLLRHEGGHAINYAYRLWEEPEWADVFGPFTRPYREQFPVRPQSRDFVVHIRTSQDGRTYAQKHPDEDFAETFAVWLTPRSGWRRRYRSWPVVRKLRYVDELMERIGAQRAKRTGGQLANPVEQLNILLAEHYGRRADHFRATAQGYVDDRLREIFATKNGGRAASADEVLREREQDLLERMTRWSGLTAGEAHTILEKLADRASALALVYKREEREEKLLDVTALVTSLAMDFAYTGRLIS